MSTKTDPDPDLDLVWRALADGTRRSILDALTRQPRTTGELVEMFPDRCRTAVMKHLGILEAVELVVVRRQGRLRWNHLNPMPIQRIYDRWVAPHVQGMASALSRLKDHVEGSTKTTTMSKIRTTKTRTTKTRRKPAQRARGSKR